jgi:catechol 2,3-dioxygenase-like lactoylglutathione lyase family enzyme
MRTYLQHLQFNVRPVNLPFYRDLFNFLGWRAVPDHPGLLVLSGQEGVGCWFSTQATEAANDYDGPGLNHIGIGTIAVADVDRVTAYLREHDIAPLFDTPRHRPEFTGNQEGQTYYQVMFASPDRILFEVVYAGPIATGEESAIGSR